MGNANSSDQDSARPSGRGRLLAWLLRLLFWHDGIILIPLAALAACVPLLWRGVSCGHDFDFHLVSWMETRRAWTEGVPYPHWAQSPNWDGGEARFVFYPPLSWTVGAALSFLAGWNSLPVILVGMMLAGAGLSTRALAKELLPRPNATLAGIAAACAPYALFTALERSAYGELASAIWIPLLILFALRLRDQDTALFPRPFAVVGTALTLAAAWLTNAPAGVMASYLLAFLTLTIVVLQRAWRPALRAVIAAGLGLGLAAFYLVPAAWEQRWVAIQQAVDVGMRVSDSWLFARHTSPDLALHDSVLLAASLIVTFTALAAGFGFAFAMRNKKLATEKRLIWLPLALLVPVIVLLQLPVSAPVWNHLPKLLFLQFPWRWLVVLAVPYSIFLAAATPLSSRRFRVAVVLAWVGLLILVIGSTSHFFFQPCDDEDNVGNQLAIFQAGTGVEGTDEYAPAGSDNSLVATGLPDACLVEDPLLPLGDTPDASPTGSMTPVWFSEQGSCDDTFDAQVWQNEYKRLEIETDHGGYLVLRLLRFPAWQILINGKQMALPADGKFPLREDGLIVVPVDPGAATIEVRWTTTPDILWGREISIAALVLLTAYTVFSGWRCDDVHLHSTKPSLPCDSFIIDQMPVDAKLDVKALISEGAAQTDVALERLIPSAQTVPASIHGAMRHSVFAGGKRLRPVLAIQAAIAVAGTIPAGTADLGAAIEMIHTYSLIHDDLPALDNDDLRRGKPTAHVVFGEAIAILAGDALQTQAYEVLAGLLSYGTCSPAAIVEIIRLVAQATGTVDGMIGGQVLDLEGEQQKPTAALVDAIHRAKTGALIRVSVVAGGIYAGATPEQAAQLDIFGRKAGLAFQIVDDVLDVTQDSAQLGKTAGKDLTSDKATWPAVFGVEQSQRDADRLISEAFAALEPFGPSAEGLKAVARYLVERKN